MADKNYKIGIVGLGFTGQPVKDFFEKKGYARGVNLFCYDKDASKGFDDDLSDADIIFVCVPTPFHPERGFISSYLEDAVSNISGEKTIVVRSTVVPGTTKKLQEKYTHHKFLFNPEFLREASSFEDFNKPDRQIIGIVHEDQADLANSVLDLLPQASHRHVVSSAEAELIKYMANSFLAMKVVFANEFYNLCQKLGVDYESVKDAVSKDKRIGSSHLNVGMDGYRGYGGSCFPKDVNALIEFAESAGVDLALMKKMREINRKFLEDSGYHEDHFLNFMHRKDNGANS